MLRSIQGAQGPEQQTLRVSSPGEPDGEGADHQRRDEGGRGPQVELHQGGRGEEQGRPE